MTETETVLQYIMKQKEVSLTEIMAHCLIAYPEACQAVDRLAREGKIVFVDRMHYKAKEEEEKLTSDKSRSIYKKFFD